MVGLLIVIGILSVLTFIWFLSFGVKTSNYIDKISEDEPFELTELSKMTPTPTPVFEKKKRGRKPKNS